MSFKFRSSFRTVTTTQKAPTFKNTASAERFSDLLHASDLLTNNSIEKHIAEVNFDDHGHPILKESGLTSDHLIIETSFGVQLAGGGSSGGPEVSDQSSATNVVDTVFTVQEVF